MMCAADRHSLVVGLLEGVAILARAGSGMHIPACGRRWGFHL